MERREPVRAAIAANCLSFIQEDGKYRRNTSLNLLTNVFRMKPKIHAILTVLLFTALTGCTSVQRYLSPSSTQQSESWLVTRISDGDTLVVERNGQEQKLRLCGVDAPEKDQPLGDEARRLLQDLIPESDQVEVVPIEEDRYGRTVAEVFAVNVDGGGEISIQEELLKAGLVWVYPRYVDGCPNGEIFKRAEAIARGQRRGVWSGQHTPPWEYRKNR